MHRRRLLSSLALTLCLAYPALAEKPWQTSDKALRLKAPDSFVKVEKIDQLSTLELFDAKQNVELVVSKLIPGRVALDKYLTNFPSMIKNEGGRVVEQSKTKVAGDPAALFVISGLVPEKIETIYVYVVPPKGSYSLVVNYPSAQRGQIMKMTKQLLTTIR